MIKISKANETHLSEIALLFDAYRVFYKQESDINKAKAFLEARIKNDESVILMAQTGKQAVGFVQLFTSFSSVSMQPVFILNDLYVHNDFRNKGIGELLLSAAKSYCKKMNYKGLALETAVDNPAQKLYERLDWKKDVHCYHYFWTAP